MSHDCHPEYAVFVVKDIGGTKKFTNVGVAYVNGKGTVTVYLHALPLDDKILLVPWEKQEKYERR